MQAVKPFKPFKSKLPLPSINIVSVNPDIARNWLESNKANRPPSKSRVQQYARLMKNGEWMLNGETLKFNVEGDLIDGQHRLLAVISCGQSIEFEIREGLPMDAFKKIDAGKPRGAADLFKMAGYGGVNHSMAAAVRLVVRQTRGLVPSNRNVSLTSQEVFDLFEQDQDKWAEATYFMHELGNKNVRKVTTESLILAMHYLLTDKDKEGAEWFLSRLVDGSGITNDMPVYVLRDRLLDAKYGNRGGLITKHSDFVGWYIKAWNATRTGATIKVLKYMKQTKHIEIV